MLSHVRIWSCPTYIKYLKIDKFGPKSDKYLFIGYLKEIKGYFFYFTEEQKVFISHKAIFLEKKFFEKETNISKIELDEVR